VRGDGGLLEYRKARSFEVCEDDHRTGRFYPQDSTSSADGVMESPMSGYSSENYVDPGVAR
uniref:Uncharacterized protein n=1 Tax=Plectus sambesii TaxID=2011161 RepID=A0A914VLD8_9BILA